MELVILTALLGGTTGLILGLTGAGGGIIATPLLVLFLNLNVVTAAPLSLIGVAAASWIGMIIGLKQGIVRYRAAFLITAIGLLITPFGIETAQLIPKAVLKLLFILLLLYQAYRYAFIKHLNIDKDFPCQIDQQTGRFRWDFKCLMTMSKLGILLGFTSGLLGVGGGFVLVPALKKHTPLNVHSVTSTSLMVLALVSTGSVLQWSAMGNFNRQLAVPFLAGALITMAIGRIIAPLINEIILRRLFSMICLISAISLTVQLIHHHG
ncbi:sulfite exporter TauE/SafE family protein [Ferrovum sp. PN-J185]|uniref:sulfite exporter TauE/SafE family protein n=1 Tax=Ferrovum sp. PN-J185 TaxID=1356306 RepID=UPI00079AA9F4|nr:sulfite exporter TauE/SafE family protein [Ferrovum sp. PN-J185]KXW55337.1 sulfite exporter TauE/SafE [Ferrovum sp. PN-J185]MCC6068491.1 sulfite exporter TauE/SafE family protein [Ferrovum sp. PN-J185]MDE1892533.1 sulfite exporter TauE/SafE family protein [Betaproteobacteria bacterium]MDE2056880.1 sulfite exporter TauE/SafE family protein [Betaproteobacteria bacterium]